MESRQKVFEYWEDFIKKAPLREWLANLYKDYFEIDELFLKCQKNTSNQALAIEYIDDEKLNSDIEKN